MEIQALRNYGEEVAFPWPLGAWGFTIRPQYPLKIGRKAMWGHEVMTLLRKLTMELCSEACRRTYPFPLRFMDPIWRETARFPQEHHILPTSWCFYVKCPDYIANNVYIMFMRTNTVHRCCFQHVDALQMRFCTYTQLERNKIMNNGCLINIVSFGPIFCLKITRVSSSSLILDLIYKILYYIYDSVTLFIS